MKQAAKNAKGKCLLGGGTLTSTQRRSNVKWTFCSLIFLGLFLEITGQAKANYIFTTIDVPGSTLTNARGINDSGEIVGLFTAAGTTHGYVLSGGGFPTLDPPGSTITVPLGI